LVGPGLFSGALVALAVYLLAPHNLYHSWITNNPNTDAGIAAYDGLFGFLYVATFALLNQAFLILAMLEWVPETVSIPAPAMPATSGPTDNPVPPSSVS
jgi:hypothetical protein